MLQRLAVLFPAVMALVLTVSGSHTASAGQIVIDATDSGWYDASGVHEDYNVNYIVGSIDVGDPLPLVFRNFFVFDLSGVTEQIIGAELKLSNPGGDSPGFAGPPATYSVHEVTTPVATLVTSNNGGAEGQAIFADLGDGTQFGSRIMSELDNGTVVSIDVIGALAALNSASGGHFAFGGALAFDPSVFDNYAFAWTPDDTLQIILTVVPEPVSATQVIVGLVGIGIWRPKRRSSRS